MRREPPLRGIDAARSVLDQLLPLFTSTRLERGLSLRSAATQLGCGIATLSEWQTGKSEPRLALVRTVVAWVAGEQPRSPDSDLVDTLTAAQRRVLDLLLSVDGMGHQAWLGVTPGGYRLVVPELSDAGMTLVDQGVFRRLTVRALEVAGLIRITSLPEHLPPFQHRDNDPRQRARVGYRIDISRERETHDPAAAGQRHTDGPVALQQELPVPRPAPDQSTAG